MDIFTKTPRPFYPSLSSQNREIRLLYLQPGGEAEKLQCRLGVVLLDSNPSYEALSYRWRSGASAVSVDGHDVLVPKNLEEALRKMRFDDKERVLWADAICIDQSDTAERNGQVALMADIYKSCKRCLIWLGSTREFDPSNEWSENLPELLTALSKKHHLDQPGAPQINPMLGFTTYSLKLLNSADWWERIWVVQEVVLAPQSLVFFGSFEMAFSDIANAMDFVNKHDIRSAWNPDGSETDHICHCMDRMKVTFIWEKLLDLRNRVYSLLSAGQQQSELSSVPVQSGRPEHQYYPNVIDVLLSVRHRDSTDPRDKIFGVLSLVQDWGSLEPIKADYSKDALQVFKEFAAQMIQSEYGTKTLLLARGADIPSSDLTGLPTWVPDWSKYGSGYDRYLMSVERQTFRSLSSQSASILGSTLALICGLSKGKIAELSTAGAPLHKSYGLAPSMEDYERYTQMLDSWRTFSGVENVLTLGGVLNRYLRAREDGQKEEGWAESGSYARLITDLKRSEHTV